MESFQQKSEVLRKARHSVRRQGSAAKDFNLRRASVRRIKVYTHDVESPWARRWVPAGGPAPRPRSPAACTKPLPREESSHHVWCGSSLQCNRAHLAPTRRGRFFRDDAPCDGFAPQPYSRSPAKKKIGCLSAAHSGVLVLGFFRGRWSSFRYPIEASDDRPHQLAGAHRMFSDFCCTSASPSTRGWANQIPTKELRIFPHRYTRLDVAPLFANSAIQAFAPGMRQLAKYPAIG